MDILWCLSLHPLEPLLPNSAVSESVYILTSLAYCNCMSKIITCLTCSVVLDTFSLVWQNTCAGWGYGRVGVRHQLRKGLFWLKVRGSIPPGGEVMVQKFEAANHTGSIVRKQRDERWCCVLTLLVIRPVPWKWYHLHLEWVFLPQLNPHRNPQTCPKVCLLDDSRSCPLDNINHHTVQLFDLTKIFFLARLCIQLSHYHPSS